MPVDVAVALGLELLAISDLELADAGLKCLDVEGVAWSPTRGLHLSDDLRLNYLVAAVRA